MIVLSVTNEAFGLTGLQMADVVERVHAIVSASPSSEKAVRDCALEFRTASEDERLFAFFVLGRLIGLTEMVKQMGGDIEYLGSQILGEERPQ